jgi:predicted nucleic acid-binding protein
LAAESEAKGTVVDRADCQIAAIAVLHDAQVATRNVRHFDYLGVAIVNLWQALKAR